MKRRTFWWIALIVIAIIAAIIYKLTHPDTGGQGGPSSIPATITFGNTSVLGCAGKGICIAAPSGTVGNPSSSIGVTFGQDPNNASRIFMMFSMAALRAAPGEAAQVTDFSANTYAFDVPYSVSMFNPIFARWRIPNNMVISPFGTSQLVLNGNALSDTMSIVLSNPVTEFVIFGDTASGTGTTHPAGGGATATTSATAGGAAAGTPAGSCNASGKGFCTVSPIQIPGSIPVTFSLQPGNAAHIVMTFSINDLQQAGQGAQVPNFQGQTSYMFASPFVFADPSFAAMQITPLTEILPSSPSSMSVNSAGVVSDTITYTTMGNLPR